MYLCTFGPLKYFDILYKKNLKKLKKVKKLNKKSLETPDLSKNQLILPTFYNLNIIWLYKVI